MVYICFVLRRLKQGNKYSLVLQAEVYAYTVEQQKGAVKEWNVCLRVLPSSYFTNIDIVLSLHAGITLEYHTRYLVRNMDARVDISDARVEHTCQDRVSAQGRERWCNVYACSHRPLARKPDSRNAP